MFRVCTRFARSSLDAQCSAPYAATMPCLMLSQPPSGESWLPEIKLDGF